MFAGCTVKSTKEIDPEFARYISAFTYGNVSTDAFVQVIGAGCSGGGVERGDRRIAVHATFAERAGPSGLTATPSALCPKRGQHSLEKSITTLHLGKVLKVEDKFHQFRFDPGERTELHGGYSSYEPMSSSDLI